MLWTDEERLQRQLEQLPKMQPDPATHARVREQLQIAVDKHDRQKRRKRRLRRIALLSLPLLLLVLASILGFTETGKNYIAHVWLDLHDNTVALDDGVVAVFRGHAITVMDVEREAAAAEGTMTDALLRVLKKTIVYEASIERGYAAVADVRDRAAIDVAVETYMRDLIGSPLVIGGNEHKRGTLAYYDLSFARHQDALRFNKQYSDIFDYRFVLDSGSGTAKLSSDVLVAFRGTPIVTLTTPNFVPSKMSIDDVREAIAYELLYQEALNRYGMRQPLVMDDDVRMRIEQSLLVKPRTAEELEALLQTLVEKETVVHAYVRTIQKGVGEFLSTDLNKIATILAAERIVRYAEEININETLAAKYRWDRDTLLKPVEREMPLEVAATYRGAPIYTYLFGEYRFDQRNVDDMIALHILAEIATEKGYTVNAEEMRRVEEELADMFADYDAATNNYIIDLMRETGLGKEEWQRYHLELFAKYDLASQISQELYSDYSTYLHFNENFREDFADYWQHVHYNPLYPFH